MIDENSDQYKIFDNLWQGKTPKGFNINKKNSCHQEGLEYSKINSYLVYSGLSKRLDRDSIIKNDIKITKPPRRYLRKF